MRVYAAFLFVTLFSCQKPASQSAKEAQQAAPSPPGQAASTPAPPEPVLNYPFKAGERTIFASGHAGEGGLRWQAGLPACSGKQCPITLWLVEGETVVDSKPVAWPANSVELRQDDAEPGWGAGDPMGSASVTVWASGDEERYVGTVVRPVKMGTVPAILVDQLRGFEHLRRNHELFAVHNRKLDRVWQGEEGTGPAWSSTAIVSLPDATEGVVYYSGFRYPSPAEPDRIETTLLRWERGALQERKDDAPREALVIGAFPSAAAAHRSRNKARDCLGTFWVLPASRFSDRTGFVLALPGATPERIRQRLEAVKKCAYNQKIEVATLR